METLSYEWDSFPAEVSAFAAEPLGFKGGFPCLKGKLFCILKLLSSYHCHTTVGLPEILRLKGFLKVELSIQPTKCPAKSWERPRVQSIFIEEKWRHFP